jgi:hypothetical protein
MDYHLLDRFSIQLLFLLTVILMLVGLEVGFRFGANVKGKKVKAQTSQVRALMGATLGLLAFMLAFTFAAAQEHFETRLQLQIDEAMLLKSAFMKAGLFEEPVRSEARALLIEYVDDRIALRKWVQEKEAVNIFGVLNRAEEVQLRLWSLGTGSSDASSGNYSQSRADILPEVLGLMESQTRRLQAALVNRIPPIIWLTLYFTAMVSMIVVGYQAGLTEKRSPLATFSLALVFSAVMVLIMDLDRPLQSLFALDTAVMDELAVFMRKI